MGILKGISEMKFTTALDYASGTASRNGAILDMAGFRGVLFVVHFAVIAPSAVVDIRMQQDVVVGFGGAADLAGSKIVVAADDDNQIFVLELWEPVERFVRGVVTKDAANASAESAFYLQYGARNRPTTVDVTDLVTSKRLASPAEGTA